MLVVRHGVLCVFIHCVWAQVLFRNVGSDESILAACQAPFRVAGDLLRIEPLRLSTTLRLEVRRGPAPTLTPDEICLAVTDMEGIVLSPSAQPGCYIAGSSSDAQTLSDPKWSMVVCSGATEVAFSSTWDVADGEPPCASAVAPPQRPSATVVPLALAPSSAPSVVGATNRPPPPSTVTLPPAAVAAAPVSVPQVAAGASSAALVKPPIVPVIPVVTAVPVAIRTAPATAAASAAAAPAPIPLVATTSVAPLAPTGPSQAAVVSSSDKGLPLDTAAANVQAKVATASDRSAWPRGAAGLSPADLASVYILHDASTCSIAEIGLSGTALSNRLCREAYAALCSLTDSVAESLDTSNLQPVQWTCVTRPDPSASLTVAGVVETKNIASLASLPGFENVRLGESGFSIAISNVRNDFALPCACENRCEE